MCGWVGVPAPLPQGCERDAAWCAARARVAQGRVAWLSNDLVNMIQISLAAALAILADQALQLPHPL